MRQMLIGLIRVYQKISLFFPRTCRFYPTCSEYMVEAIQKYGVGWGLWKGVKRLIKCHPLHPGGYDPLI